MPAVRLLLLLLAAVAVGSSSAVAQSELHVFRGSGYGLGGFPKLNSGALFAIDVDPPARLVGGLTIEETATGPIVTADGRYVMFSAQRGQGDRPFILVWDSRTLTRFEFAVPEFRGGVMAADHHRVRVYITDPANNRLLVAEAGGMTAIAMTGSPTRLRMSSDGRDLYVLQLKNGVTELVIVSPATFEQRLVPVSGRLVDVIPTLPGEFIGFDIDSSSHFLLTRYDSQTGAALATHFRDQIAVFLRPLAYDAATRQVVVDSSDPVFGGHFSLLFFDPETLTITRTIRIPRSSLTISAVVADPRLKQDHLVGQYGGFSHIPCGTAFVDRLDADYSYVHGADLPGYGCAGATLAPHPPPPKDVSAAVAGARVTLEWAHGDSAPGLANDWRIEAFSGNRIIASVRTGQDTPGFSVSGVPSGTYRVLVTGVNDAGVGEPSQEIVVVVP